MNYPLVMKTVSDARKLDIAYFSSAVRAAGERLVPHGSDAERIRRLAEELRAGVPAVKKWFYGQNAPRGCAAQAILALLEGGADEG